MKKGFSIIVSMLTFICMNSYAFEFDKPIAVPLKTTPNTHAFAPTQQTVYIMSLRLSPKEKSSLVHFAKTSNVSNKVMTYGAFNDKRLRLPLNVNLGMNGVPVLNQGRHGTCATFAITAAVDAAIGKGDYISQLCQLELGSALTDVSYLPSGWNGSYGSIVLDQMLRFGIISKDKQTSQSCAGVTEYPLMNEANEGNPFSQVAYKAMSENLQDYGVFASTLLTNVDRLSDGFTDQDANDMIMQVKQALSQGDRAVIGAILEQDLLNSCTRIGTCGSNHVTNDTWVLTNAMLGENHEFAGHALVIFGYDDKAVAVDAQGNKHRGLFFLRNSWGPQAGDQGNYYMSYDYFRYFVADIQIIHVANQ